MRRYDLLLRKEGSTYIIMFGREDWKSSSLAQIRRAVGLRFVLKSEDPYFLNITEIPFFKWSEERFYFHNLHLPEGTEHYLSHRSTVGAADLVPPAQLPCELIQGMSDVPLTLRLQESPKPIMTLGQEPPPEPVMCKWEDFGVTPGNLGIVDIYVGRTDMMLRPPSGMSVLEQVPTYQLHFQARATRWRYHLINQGGSLPEVTQVLADGKKILDLEDEGTRSLQTTNQTARVFSLKEALTLEERPKQRLKLQYTLKNEPERPNGSTGSVDLPVPDGRKISPLMESSEILIFSDIFVYL